MYIKNAETTANTPERHAQPRSGPHIHPPEKSLSEHENSQQFETFLKGREFAYEYIIRYITEILAEAANTQKRNTRDAHIWALTEGQLEGLKEILHTLEKTKELDPS